jgi:hypothetical protein
VKVPQEACKLPGVRFSVCDWLKQGSLFGINDDLKDAVRVELLHFFDVTFMKSEPLCIDFKTEAGISAAKIFGTNRDLSFHGVLSFLGC